jgi:hypothetical protein
MPGVYYRFISVILLVIAALIILEAVRTIKAIYCHYQLYLQYREIIRQLQERIHNELRKNKSM